MKITEVRAENYRLLKKLNLEIEENLSVVIGKNNCGKTSLLTLLDKFLSSRPSSKTFQFEDFNLDFQEDFKKNILDPEYVFDKDLGIVLQLIIQYEEGDSLKNLYQLLLDLKPEKKHVVLSFEYKINKEGFKNLRNDFGAFKISKEQQIKKNKLEEKKVKEDKSEILSIEDLLTDFLKKKYHQYFKPKKKSLSYKEDDLGNIIVLEGDKIPFKDLDKEIISITDLINFQFISARRKVSNKSNNKTLSELAFEYYEKKDLLDESNPSQEVEDFRELLSKTDKTLDKTYDKIFRDLIEQVELFGGTQKGDSKIKVNSSLQDRNLLSGNTTVTYNHDNQSRLPEHYNGLGYMNLISMIFEIEIMLHNFQRFEKSMSNPADINLFFIEEPEAHTHPQMQYVFIKNIKTILNTAKKTKKLNTLQTIISTHSSHITSESKFDDIKYFQKQRNSVVAKNLSALKKAYKKDNEEHYFKFLKQYLTLHRSELFFADKAIFIEGDTERILVPAMMKKIDQDDKSKNDLPLLSQNISIIETGAHSQVYEKFIDFIGIKSLILTDIDAKGTWKEEDKTGDMKDKTGACPVNSEYAHSTSNGAINFYLKGMNWEEIKNSSKEKRILLKKKNEKNDNYEWTPDKEGHLLVCYQTKEEEYHARSFEDAFFHLNKNFITKNEFSSLTKKYIKKFKKGDIKVYDFAEKAVNSKPALAMEILLNSTEKNDRLYLNWRIPQYIKEGLQWLKS
ncbi:AAA family ATPase [Tenacibaculum halocynthiae]|uniref:AAA family ATPase n=1 Tax=Tenacibaculum halocynthiae TaxID=1254437 RepID=UPI003D646E96